MTHRLIIFIFFPLLFISLPAYSNPIERYENILKSTEYKAVSYQPLAPQKWELNFEHERFPNLDGIWKFTRKTITRLREPLLTMPITQIHCNSRLPFERRDFENKEVIINSRGPDFFVVKAIHPVTSDIYYDPNLKKELIYENYGLKAVLDPDDITYAYTLKLDNYIEHPNRPRQIWLNGKLKYDFISRDKITGKGYEIVYTPSCTGFLMDEIKFELVRSSSPPAYGENIISKSPDKNIPEGVTFPKQPDSAKDRSGFEPALIYKPIDTGLFPKQIIKVPGLW